MPSAWHWLFRAVLLAGLCGTIIGDWFSSAYDRLLSATVYVSLLVGNILTTTSKKKSPFVILTYTAGYDQKDEVSGLITFREVAEATETAAALQIRHRRRDGPFATERKVVLPRHQFAVEDWEKLVGIILDRIRAQSPEAKIRTPLHPKG